MSAADSGSETQLPDLDTLDVQSLKALILAKQAELESLKLLIVKLKRMHFGASSEKYDRDLQQLELRLEDLEANQASAELPPTVPATVACKQTAPLKPARRPLPTELPVALQILSITRSGSGDLLNCLGVPNAANRVEKSDDLTVPNSFTTLASPTADANGAFQFTDPNPGDLTKRFYRLAYP